MKIKVVTDSTADLPQHLAEELGITVIPSYVCFGDKSYRDQTEITADRFYQMLKGTTQPLTTMPPTPKDFATVYRRLSEEADAILSVHISSKISATYQSALRGIEMTHMRCPICVIDSKLVTMGLGLLTMTAARLAQSGGDLETLAAEVENTIPHVRILGYIDSLEYLAKSRRIGRAKALLGSVLSVKPLLTMKSGELSPVGQVHSKAAGVEKLIDFIKDAGEIRELALVYGTSPDEAQPVVGMLKGVIGSDKVWLARLGPVIGVHTGPDILFTALRI